MPCGAGSSMHFQSAYGALACNFVRFQRAYGVLPCKFSRLRREKSYLFLLSAKTPLCFKMLAIQGGVFTRGRGIAWDRTDITAQ